MRVCFGKVANLLPQMPLEGNQQLGLRLHHRIFQAILPVNLKATIHVLKKEAIAITLLFFSALRLLPNWLNIACAICGIARVIWSLLQSHLKIEDLEEAGYREGRLAIEKGDLEAARNRAVLQRNQAEAVKDQLEHANEIAKLNQHRLAQENGAVRQKIEDLAIQLNNEIQIHEKELGKVVGYDRINQGLVKQVDAMNDERALLMKKIQEQVANMMKLGDEREALLKKQEEAFQQKIAIQQELANVQKDPIWEKWEEIEQRRNELLLEVTQLFKKGIQNVKEANLTQVELIATKILPDLEEQKKGTIAILDNAIGALPAGHPSLLSLQKLKGIHEMEKDALKGIANVLALPLTIRRLMVVNVERK